MLPGVGEPEKIFGRNEADLGTGCALSLQTNSRGNRVGREVRSEDEHRRSDSRRHRGGVRKKLTCRPVGQAVRRLTRLTVPDKHSPRVREVDVPIGMVASLHALNGVTEMLGKERRRGLLEATLDLQVLGNDACSSKHALAPPG